MQLLTNDELLEIHEKLNQRYGGQPGIRDPGMLESALFRPRTGYYEDLAEMGAALFESLIMNHPFVDGNKRVAFFGTDVFFRLNGYKLEIVAAEAYPFLIGLLEKGECNFENLLRGIRHTIIRL
ncbi:MAG: type II toxin-antitoxin system death-on-curing family toxin [Gammaproteobacteria bacterium]|nr:type II toxin-antitoxin system death-on-curing family toxin [Gammaproteobacteria bacterium]